MKLTEILETSENIQGSYRYDILTQEECELLNDIDSIRLKMETKLRQMQQMLPEIKNVIENYIYNINDDFKIYHLKDLLTKIQRWEDEQLHTNLKA